MFDLWADRQPHRFAWTRTGSSNAWLALDRNENGQIDDGSELFGSATAQPTPPPGEAPNGFRALAVFDQPENGGNDDGMIDSRDAVYSKLVLWTDLNHNGMSDPGELKPLSGTIERIDLNYSLSKRVDEFGNMFYLKARVWDIKGRHGGRFAWDVSLQKLP